MKVRCRQPARAFSEFPRVAIVIQARNWRGASFIRRYLTNARWERIEMLCPGKEGDKGRLGEDNRRFVEGVLWINRTGAPWRDLPDEFGNSEQPVPALSTMGK